MCVGGAFGTWLLGRADGVESQANKLDVEMAIIKTDLGHIKTTQNDIKLEQGKMRADMKLDFERLYKAIKNGRTP